MRINSSGNLGVGTTSPAYKLDVTGELRATSVLRANSNAIVGGYLDLTGDFFHRDDIKVLNKAASNWLIWAQRDTAASEVVVDLNYIGTITPGSDSAYDIGTNTVRFANGYFDTLYGDGSNLTGITATETDTLDSVTGRGATTTNSITVGGLTVDTSTLHVDASNNRVGIGTTSPETLLHLESTSTGLSPILTVENDNDIKLKLGAVRSLAGTAPDTTFIAYDSSLRFIADADSTTEVARISSSGNLLIGTTTDSTQKLQVNGMARFDSTVYVGEYITHLGDGNTAIRFLDDSIQFNAGGVAMMKLTEGSADTVTINPDSADVNFQVNGDTVANLLFVDGGTSKVGIGTSSPAYRLDIKGTSNNIGDGNQIFSVGNTSGGTQLAIGSSEDSYTWIRSYESGVGGRDLALVTNNEAVRIKSGGNVLIGTTTDNGYKLAVSGGDAQINGVNVGKGGGSVAQNTIVGYGALTSTTTGNYNTALGYQAGYSNTTGERNTAVGRQALRANSTGSYNVALGMDALNNNTASNNTALGYQAAYSNTSGNIVAIGWQAGFANTTGTITAVGYQALKANTTGGENVAVGRESMRLATASNNTAVGTYSGYVLTTGSGNTIVGRRALFSATTAGYNVAIGAQALYSNVSNNSNVAVGEASLYNNTQNYNTAVGNNAARNNTTGSIVAFGYQAGYSNTTAIDITSVGYQAARNNTASYVTAIGHQAAYNNTTALTTTAIGRRAVYNNTTGGYNVGVGINTLVNTTSGNNTAIGSYAGDSNTTGENNIFIGNNSDGASATDSNRTWIGNSSTTSTWVGGNLLVGTTTDGGQPLQVKGSNNIAYFRGDTGYSDITFRSPVGNEFHMTLGGGDSLVFNSTTNERMRLTSAGSLGIGTASPDYELDVAGDIGIDGYIHHNGDDSKIGFEGNDAIRIYTANSVAMQIDSSQRVGIGTTSPNHKLDIYSNENVPLRIHRPSNANLNSSGAWGIGFSTRGDANTSTSDTRAGIFSYYNGNLFIATSTSDVVADPDASARLTVTAAGNVGIGTSIPTDKLTVNGNIGLGGNKIYNGSASNSAGIDFSDAQVDLHGYYGIRFFASTAGIGSMTERMRIVNNGNVLIGTTTDSGYKLNVNGTAYASEFDLPSGGQLDWANGDARIKEGDVSNYSLSFQTYTGSALTTKMFINSGGNIGVGTTSPYGKLNVIPSSNPTTATDANQITVGESSSNSQYNLRIGYFLSGGAYKGSIQAISGNTPNTLVLNGDGGSVGIGTYSPSEKLEVAGNIQASGGYIYINDTNTRLSQANGNALKVTTNSGNIELGPMNTSHCHVQTDRTNFYFNKEIRVDSGLIGSYNENLQLRTSATTRMTIVNSSGNVLIGTTTDNGSKLQVIGDLFVKGSDTSSSTKNFQVQTGNGTSIMDFRNDAYAFFGCGQGGGSASGFIFRYNSTFGVQFTGYNYGNGTSPSYKPILMDTDLAGRSQGVYVNYGITGYTAPAPTTTAEFAVRGRGTSSSFTAKFEDSATNPLLYIKDNGNVMIGTGTDSGYKLDVEGNTNTNGDYYVNGTQGWSGTININTNPPVAITVEGGIITNVT
jgi:hypothetical protein